METETSEGTELSSGSLFVWRERGGRGERRVRGRREGEGGCREVGTWVRLSQLGMKALRCLTLTG